MISSQQLSPESIYQNCINIWLGEFTNAYVDGKGHEEKHQYRRAKLVEYLQSLSPETLQELKGYAENKQISNDAIYMRYPKPIHLKERATGRAILTIITEITGKEQGE